MDNLVYTIILLVCMGALFINAAVHNQDRHKETLEAIKMCQVSK